MDRAVQSWQIVWMSRVLCSLLVVSCVRTEEISTSSPSVPRPAAVADNVLVILMDDVGQDKIGAYGVHPSPPPTPNIDALAHSGVRFTQAWAYPMCSPTRSALLTGQHTRRYGIGDRLTPNVSAWELPAGATVTLPQMLEAAPESWETSLIGKWHLSAGNLGVDPLHHPLLHGFQWSEGPLANLYAAVTSDYPQAERDYFLWEEIDNGTASWRTEYATSEVVDDAISRANAMQEPWLLWVALPSAHDPLHVPPASLYSGPAPYTDLELFEAMVQAMDVEIGRLFAGIPQEILDRTNIILMGDNGTEDFGIAAPLDTTRNKGSVYEGGVRVPFIVSGPAVAAPGSVSDALVHVVDIYPTVAELAGVDTASLITSRGTPVALDGESFVAALQDPADPGRDKLYVEFFGPNGPGPYTTSNTAVRDADYKYIRHVDGSEELYRLGPEELSEGEDILASAYALSPEEQAELDSLSLYLDEVMADVTP